MPNPALLSVLRPLWFPSVPQKEGQCLEAGIKQAGFVQKCCSIIVMALQISQKSLLHGFGKVSIRWLLHQVLAQQYV